MIKSLQKTRSIRASILSSLYLVIFLGGSIIAFSQDAAVAPTNGYVYNPLLPTEVFKIPWITSGGNGTGPTAIHFGTVTAPAVTGWIDTPKIVDNNLATTDYAQYTSSVTALATTYTTTPVSISDGFTYNTTPFTGYRVGVNVSRATTGLTVASFGNIIIKTYLGASTTPVETSPSLSWAALGTTDVSFFVHKPFDRVEVQLASIGTGLGTLNQRIHNVYFQRYTRTGGGYDIVGDKIATCNAQIPLTGRGVTASGLAYVAGIPVPAILWPGLVPALEDEDPNTHGAIPYASTGLSIYSGKLEDNGVDYPAGTFGGGVYSLASVGTSVNVTKTLRFYSNGNPTPVYVAPPQQEFFSATAAVNLLTVGAVCPVEFDAIEFEITLNLSLTGGILDIYYPIVQRFCDAEITCGAPVSLISGEVTPGGAQNQPVYAKAIGTSVLSASLGNPGINNIQRVIDTDLNNYAEIGAATGASLFSNYGISVISRQKMISSDPDTTTNRGYPDGTFAGFEIQDDSFATVTAAKNFIISTYKNGAEVGSYNTLNIAAGNLFTPNNGKYIIGFKSPAFDEVRITVELLAGASAGSSTKVYRAVIEKFCQTTAQACNTITNLKRPAYPVYIDAANTGVTGFATGNVYFKDLDNLVADTDEPAKLIDLVGGIFEASVAVQDGSKGIGNLGDPTYELYPAGTFAGFDVAFPTLIAAELAGSTITISTLNADGEVVDFAEMNSSFFGLHTSVLNGTDNRQILGFASDQPFTGVKLTVNKAVSGSLAELEIYSAVIQRFCTAPVIACDEIENISVPTYPLYINGERTGVTAFIDGNSSVSLSQNAIDDDIDSYATMQLGATAFSELGFSVANGFGDFPKDTYIGFDIETLDVAQASAFEQNKIELYQNGNLVQTSTGTQLAGGLSTAAVAGGFQRLIIGTVAHVPFDEVRYVITRAAGASAGEIRIYNVVARDFSPTSTTTCPLVLQCDGTYVLTDGPTTTISPTIPAVIEYANTGYEGLASAGYGIDNVWNAVSPDPTDFATLHLPAAAGVTGSISVAIPKVTLPPGTFAGFTVDKTNFPFSGAFLPNVKVTTYLNGQYQEHRNGSALIDFSFFTQWFGTNPNIYTPGFQATLPFDEVKISIESLASLGDQTLKVYSAYIDTRTSVITVPGDGNTPIICDICTKPGVGGAALTSSVGVTTKGAESSVNNWPQSVPNGYLVLDAAQKGMVITHMTTLEINALTPVEGMLVYDTDADCVKMYRGTTPGVDNTRTGWVCIKRGCNVNL